MLSYPKQNELTKVLIDIGLIERTLLILDWVKSGTKPGKSVLPRKRFDSADKQVMYMEMALEALKRKGLKLDKQLLSHLSL